MPPKRILRSNTVERTTENRQDLQLPSVDYTSSEGELEYLSDTLSVTSNASTITSSEVNQEVPVEKMEESGGAGPVQSAHLIEFMERMFKLQCEEKKADDERRREEHRLFQDRLEKLELQRHEHELALRVSARRDKTIDKIVPYQDGTEIEHFVQSLEIELTQSKIPIAEWKRVLTSKLSPKLKHLVADIIDNSDLTYGDLKAKLYR